MMDPDRADYFPRVEASYLGGFRTVEGEARPELVGQYLENWEQLYSVEDEGFTNVYVGEGLEDVVGRQLEDFSREDISASLGVAGRHLLDELEEEAVKGLSVDATSIYGEGLRELGETPDLMRRLGVFPGDDPSIYPELAEEAAKNYFRQKRSGPEDRAEDLVPDGERFLGSEQHVSELFDDLDPADELLDREYYVFGDRLVALGEESFRVYQNDSSEAVPDLTLQEPEASFDPEDEEALAAAARSKNEQTR